MRRTRVVIADRHPVTLQGLSRVLGAHRDFKIVAHCGDGATCIKAIRTLMPDIAIVDVPTRDMARLANSSSENARTRLVFFTSSIEDRDLRMLVTGGVHTVIPKDVDPDLLVQILRKIADGQKLLQLPWFDQAGAQEQSAVVEQALTALTDRELQIMRLVSQGLSNKEIGRRLNITDGTIKVHLHHIFQKLDIGNRTSLAALAISQNDIATSSLGNHGPRSRRRRRPS